MNNQALKQDQLVKTKSHAFGKDCYLLGRVAHGDLIWLESAKWDCGWYWGFGYVEVYTNQRAPSLARDISSHSHFSGLVGKQDSGQHISHVNESLQESVLTESESWELSDLMKTFYTLRESAETVGRGGSHLSGSGSRDFLKSTDMAETINKIMLPQLFEEVYKILS